MTGFAWSIIEFREPWWLLLALQPLLISLLISFQYRRQSRAYADPELMPWVEVSAEHYENKHTTLYYLAMQLCWLLLALSMAGPRYPDPLPLPDRANAADIMVVMDVSRSMSATDIRPSRLKRAKTELFQLLQQNSTDRIGIILFAGHAHLLTPLTWDRKALHFYIEGIQSNLLPTEGSNLVEAIRLANQYLQGSERAAIMVLSDGETQNETTLSDELTQTPLYIMGMGSETGISIPADDGGWIMHNNSAVRSRLQQASLQKLASASGGRYVKVTDESGMLGKLYQQTGRLSDKPEKEASLDQSWVELYAWVLLPALLILFLMSVKWSFRLHRQKLLMITMVLVLSNLVPVDHVHAETLDPGQHQQAFAAYSEKNYQAAMEIYSIHTGYLARMGEGSSAYQLKDYARSITQFTQAFLIANDDNERANALYNLANSFFQVEKYDSALTSFEDVLRYNSQHQAAQANLEFVQAVIDSMAKDPFSKLARAKRAGRGPRSLKADENTRGSGDFSLDDEETKKETSRSAGTDQDPGLLDVIASGEGRVQVADESIVEQDASVIGPVSVGRLFEARRLVLKSKRDQSVLWKSLFEDEEGFPAPLERPVVESGVLPW